MFAGLKKEHIIISWLLLGVGFVVVLFVVGDRLSRLVTPELPTPDYSHTFKIKWISFITLEHGAAQVNLYLSSVPAFSDEWEGKPKVTVKWWLKNLAGETYSGTSEAVLARPYKSFVFTVREALEEELAKVHTEKLIINEARRRIIRETNELHVDVFHPETKALLDSYTQKYKPERRIED
jgi:hypothetical protein